MLKEPAGARLQKKDFIAMLSVAMAAGSVFFPWFHIGLVNTQSRTPTFLSYGLYSGTFVEGGLVGLSLAIFCIMLIYLKIKWSGFLSIGNALIGVVYLFGWSDLSGKFISEEATKSQAFLKVEPQAGLYFFIVCSLLSTALLFQKKR
jgi:hypothetical protein